MENIKDESFKKFLDELKNHNKLSLTNAALQTKYFREIAGEDDDKREKQLDDILKAMKGEKTSEVKESTPLEDTKADIKSIFGAIEKAGKGFLKFASSPLQSTKQGIETLASGAERAVGSIEGLFEPEKPQEDTEKIKTQKGSAKEKIELTKPVSINPEADNIETPQEIIADNAEKSTKISQELLDTTVASLKELKLIKEALLAPQPTQEPTAKQSNTPLIDASAGAMGLGGVDLNLGGSKQKPALLGGGPGRKPTTTTPSGSKKPGLLSKIKGVGSKALGALGGAARVAGPIGAAMAVGSAVYGGVSGASRANEMFGVEEGKEATTGQKISAGLGGVVSGLTMGLVDEKSVAEGAYGIGKKVGSFFGFGGDEEKTSVEGIPSSESNESNKGLMIAGEPFVEGQPLSEKQMAVISMARSMGNNYPDAVERQYENQRIAEKLESVDKAKYGGPVPTGPDEFTSPVEAREAGGSITAGKPYLVGEEGPEIVVPSENSTVVPNDKKAAKAVPQIVETIDMGNGAKKEIMDDGSYTISNAEGITKYDAKGTAVSKITSGFGVRKEENLITGEVNTSYSQGPLYVSKKTNKAGEVIEESGSYDLGLAKVSYKTSSGKTTTSAEIRNGTNENLTLRDEISATGNQTQPVVMNNVNNTSTNTYIPMKADPRPSHRGSALDNYLSKSANY